MITIIFGDPGVGKTALMTSFAVKRMTIESKQDVHDCKSLIKSMNKGGWKLTAPKKHLVFANYNVTAKMQGFSPRVNFEVDGFYLGLPNKKHPTIFLPPYSQIFLIEAQKYYNSRMSQYLEDFVSRFYETHRHNFLNLTMDCQRETLIDLNIRAISGRFIEVKELKHYYYNGKIIKSVWTCNEFYNGAEVEEYIQSNNKNNASKKIKYVYHGNIFDCYDSRSCFAYHYNGRYKQDFDLHPSKPVGKSIQSIKEFNENHSYETPKTYYKKKGKDNAT